MKTLISTIVFLTALSAYAGTESGGSIFKLVDGSTLPSIPGITFNVDGTSIQAYPSERSTVANFNFERLQALRYVGETENSVFLNFNNSGSVFEVEDSEISKSVDFARAIRAAAESNSWVKLKE